MNNNVLNLAGKCSGCGACVTICPYNAIEYKLNEEGFYAVNIIKERCIKCGLCTSVCFKNIENNNKLKNIKKDGQLISARTKNKKILKECTSGAIAYEIGKYGIENGYKVVGTIYDVKEQIAKTIVVDNKEEFEKIKGSKYLQSKSDEAIKNIIKITRNNSNEKLIIFGTPCQIYGYRMVIEKLKINNEIIYIELFCHGVPSYLIWNKYLNEQKNNEKIKKVDFRNKKYGWHNFTIKIEKNKNKCKYSKAERDNFYKIFFDNIFLNKSCMNCKLRKEESNADIRLGDFWGKKYSLDTNGVSAVLIFTKKGKQIIDKINSNIEILEKNIPIEECLKYQSVENYQEKYSRTQLIKDIKTNENLTKIIKQYRNDFPIKYKVKCKIKTILSYLPLRLNIKIKSKFKS